MLNHLVPFCKDGLELVIDTQTGECFASQSAVGRMCGKSESTISRWIGSLAQIEQKTAEIQTPAGLRSCALLDESAIFEAFAKYNPSLLAACAKAGIRLYLHRLAGYEIKVEAKDDSALRTLRERQILEQAYNPPPVPTLKQIKEAASLYQSAFGKAYKQRYVQQMVQKYHPSLAGCQAEKSEVESLPSAKVLLTPTQLAEQLGLKHQTGSPNAQAVNQLLAKLGYQIKIANQWSATEKAIAAKMCDRKPVETGSRTQKDQLLWTIDILPVLAEHTLSAS
jgi:hypothetical protein